MMVVMAAVQSSVNRRACTEMRKYHNTPYRAAAKITIWH